MIDVLHLSPRRLGLRGSVILAAAALLLGGAGSAYAYWSAAGSGSGSSAAGQLQALTAQALVQPASGQLALAPGGTGDAVLRVTNPNPYPVQLYSAQTAGTVTADAGHPQCVTTGVAFHTPPGPLYPSVTIPGNSTQTVTLAGSVTMDLSSDAGCQGALFNLPLTLEVRK